MKTRDNMVRDYYLNKKQNNLLRPRPQTGPKASFMGEMNRPRKKKENNNDNSPTKQNLLSKLGRKRVILDRTGDKPYLERYYLFLKNRKKFPFNIFLHKFLQSDPDELHDHPWPYFSLILKGGYWETTPMGCFWRAPGYFQMCEPKSLHRIELKPNVPAWTLFIPGRKRREWGFIVNGKWMHHLKYFKWRKNA